MSYSYRLAYYIPIPMVIPKSSILSNPCHFLVLLWTAFTTLRDNIHTLLCTVHARWSFVSWLPNIIFGFSIRWQNYWELKMFLLHFVVDCIFLLSRKELHDVYMCMFTKKKKNHQLANNQVTVGLITTVLDRFYFCTAMDTSLSFLISGRASQSPFYVH